jgi:hypothetical protein
MRVAKGIIDTEARGRSIIGDSNDIFVKLSYCFAISVPTIADSIRRKNASRRCGFDYQGIGAGQVIGRNEWSPRERATWFSGDPDHRAAGKP